MLCLAGCLAACVTAVSATAARPASGQPATRVMTCNVRITGLPEDETAGRRWEDRRDACLKAIRMYRPDVICMQEVIYDSYNYFKEKFSDYVAYGFAGPEMDPYTEGYHFIGKNVIFFSKKRYEFVSSGCYWLSETPLAAGSCSWNTMRARHCNWVRLRDRKSGAEFRVLDIHLDHKSDDARREQMKMIVGECAQYADGSLLQMWQTSHYDDYCWDLMVSTIAISCKRFAGLRTARKEVNNTIPIINASGKIGILHAVPQKFVMRLAKTTQCIGSPMIQPKIIPLTAYVIASATIIFMSC